MYVHYLAFVFRTAQSLFFQDVKVSFGVNVNFLNNNIVKMKLSLYLTRNCSVHSEMISLGHFIILKKLSMFFYND